MYKFHRIIDAIHGQRGLCFCYANRALSNQRGKSQVGGETVKVLSKSV